MYELPSDLYIGLDWVWAEDLPDYPSSGGHVAKYTFLNANFAQVVTGTATSTDTHQFSVTDHTGWISGYYSAILTVDNIHIVTLGSTVHGDINTQYDGRTPDKICLDNIEAVLTGKASKDNYSYTIAGRQLNKYSWEDLLKARDYFQGKVAAEQAAANYSGSNRIVCNFTLS